MQRLLLFFGLFLITHSAFAQRSRIHEDPEGVLRYGKELMEKQKYAAAKSVFESILSNEFPKTDVNLQVDLQKEANFYRAVAGVELRQTDADYRLLQFIETYPEDLRSDEAKFYLGRYYFEAKKYRDVILVLSGTDAMYFNTAQVAAYHYYLGYSYFTRDSFELAKTSLAEVSELQSEYRYPANYYLGFIAYQKGDNALALKHFMRLTDSKHYNRIVPYFIAKLYFEQGRYDDMLQYTLPLSGNREVKNQAGINYLIAQAYIRQEAYIKAIPYMNRYLEMSGNGTSNDYYQLGFAQYQAKEYAAAAPNLSKSTSRKDTIGQHASYLLGDVFLKLGQKEKALASFYTTSRLNYDPEIQELAAFNHAKLGYELNIHPQSLTWLREFLIQFPKSKYGDEVRTLLGELLLSTKNFKEAIQVIEAITERNLAINRSYQKVTYFRGIELFNQGVYQEAVKFFDKSLTQSLDKNFTAQAYFWKGESLYKLNRLKDAISELQKFVQTWPATTGLEVENSLITAYYTLGYAWFKQNDNLLAIASFEKSYENIRSADKKVQMNAYIGAMFGDLLLRLGDAYFAANSYADAQGYYQQAIDRKMPGSDYASFQKAILQGLTNNTDQKIATLRKLATDFSGSLYYDNALLELANTYFIQDKLPLAQQTFDRLIKERPNSLLLKNAYLIKGLIHFNEEQYEVALTNYKIVVEGYPKTAEARDALNGIKNIYILQNNVDAFFSYAATVPNSGVTINLQDSVTFQAAELVYNQGNCEQAIVELSKYLIRFPDGYFAIQARFLRADCYDKQLKYEFMEQDLLFVVAQKRSLYSERSHARLAKFYFTNKTWDKAIVQFERLETLSDSRWNIRDAYLGQMRAYTLLNDTAKSRLYAQKVTNFPHSTEQDKLEAAVIFGQLAFYAGDLSAAYLQFSAIYEATKNEFGAKSKYYIAAIQLKRNELAACQASVFELVDKIPYYDEWIAQAFLILAETYIAQADYFQANATLQSIIDNRDEDEITRKAVERMAYVKTLEGAGNKTNQENNGGNQEQNEGGANNEN